MLECAGNRVGCHLPRAASKYGMMNYSCIAAMTLLERHDMLSAGAKEMVLYLLH